MNRLEGKTAIITGGSQSMGASHARLFIKEGANVVIADINAEKGEALAKELGEKAAFIKLDVSKKDEWEQCVAKTEALFGPVNILINNAGIACVKPIMEHTIQEYMRTVEVDQLGCFLGMQCVHDSMVRAGNGAIINVSSQAGLKGAPGGGSYCAAKFAVTGMTKVAAIEWAKDNIRVNSIHPSTVETPFIRAKDHEDLIPAFLQSIPQRRFCDPIEVSYLVLFLASDEASFCTGGQYLVDGGALAG